MPLSEGVKRAFEDATREQLYEMIMRLRWQRTRAKIHLRDIDIGSAIAVLEEYPEQDVFPTVTVPEEEG